MLERPRTLACKGTGKPEPLKQDLGGWWSRRINGEDHLVYLVRARDECRCWR
jgi:toxin YoeB